ncbi:MAG: DUF1573 domain-containing protein [Ferruginibacter sp.]
MKKLLFGLMTLALTTGAFAQKKSEDVAKFKSETIDLGKLQQGTPSTAIFSVANIGTEPLIIEQANPTCGCTISDYTKEPIANGKAGSIKATYNAANVGAFEKHLTVKFAGVADVKSITIKGEVLSKEDYAKLNGGSAAETTTPATSTEVIPADAAVMPAAATPSKSKTVVKTDGKKTKTKTKSDISNKKKK